MGVGSGINRIRTGGKCNSYWKFWDGRINVYDTNGVFQGQLKDGSTPISIEGLWEITFLKNVTPIADQNKLFFTSGPADEKHGVFGYIKLK
ncbi:MAG: hypothetical protein HYZ42_04160 [Bacteroidetes bacterium]|nr:hypothetical protein [Bacteroidota bacterium]